MKNKIFQDWFSRQGIGNGTGKTLESVAREAYKLGIDSARWHDTESKPLAKVDARGNITVLVKSRILAYVPPLAGQELEDGQLYILKICPQTGCLFADGNHDLERICWEDISHWQTCPDTPAEQKESDKE